MSGPITEGLAAYLRREAGDKGDCADLMGGWVFCMKGINPHQIWLVRFQKEAPSLLRETGRAMRACGFRLTRQPQEGDVAIIAADVLGKRLLLGAIRTATGWATRSERHGVEWFAHNDRVRIVAAWKVI